jgi:short-subunit dehydrogenase
MRHLRGFLKKPQLDPSFDDHRKVVFITGASSGIGRAVALQYGTRHACIALVARRVERLEKVAEEVIRSGGQALVIPTDVAERSQIEAAIHEVEVHWRRLDVLVNNAGYGVFGSVEECYPEDFEQQMKVNYLAAVYATKIALPLMRRQGSGAIINVSSISGKATSPYDATYCASKFALHAFNSILQMELAGTGISVSLVSPGYTKTEWQDAVVQRRPYIVRTPLAPMSPERVAQEIVACSERPKREIIVPRILALPVLVQAILPGLYQWWQSRYRR